MVDDKIIIVLEFQPASVASHCHMNSVDGRPPRVTKNSAMHDSVKTTLMAGIKDEGRCGRGTFVLCSSQTTSTQIIPAYFHTMFSWAFKYLCVFHSSPIHSGIKMQNGVNPTNQCWVNNPNILKFGCFSGHFTSYHGLTDQTLKKKYSHLC